MDAFAISADNVPDTNSVRSIPTSFVSDLAAGSVVDHEAFLSVATARGRTYRQSSSSLNISTNTLSLGYDHEGVYGLRGDLGSRQSRGDMQSPTRTTSCGKPVSTVVAGGTAKSNQALKVFGEKIKKAFGVRTRQAGSGIGITTTTAITAVEYKSVWIDLPSIYHITRGSN
ncbi:uncharacterized protein PHACADRAFT_247278 [Phanerochaete carnosa HHB-10118-sp]|uniref:Uncharacterized protein n=1 Tax=Phanerochaete carnosa (strain HHB-10118-sp) TaxID=650164 RepID=K5WNH7_PHACS|nr:uncharacterized protein PHACADRAFT_247278 [Phanerochaete carnosa HHB-10118-sp]EKM60995.1 hypothetical protein PHACADRAFT_247278 [Phanerochaete carnosa HHB-10118-sp]